ncbi:MAG: hypothetical protein AAF446_11090, partial [Pseudomonadota bacterium]
GFLIALLWFVKGSEWVLPIAFSTAAMLLLGWLDDVYTLNVRWRLGWQAMIAMIIVLWLGPVSAIQWAGHVLAVPWLWSVLAVPALIWMVNLFNFMDGSDGLATSQSLISALGFALAFYYNGQSELALIALCLAAASAGFLFWNRPPARIFLGDAGSLPLGWCLGLLALVGTLTGSISVCLAFVIVSVFVVDTTATLMLRVIKRERWYTAHRDHAYQRLIRKNWSHRQVLLVFIALNLMLVMPVVVLVLTFPGLDFIGALGLGMVLLGLWAWVQFQSVAENRKNEVDHT